MRHRFVLRNRLEAEKVKGVLPWSHQTKVDLGKMLVVLGIVWCATEEEGMGAGLASGVQLFLISSWFQSS